MKKYIATFLAIAMIFSLCACTSVKFNSEAQKITDDAIEMITTSDMNLITFGPSEGTWCKIDANTMTIEYGLPVPELTYDLWKCLLPLYENDEDMDEEMLKMFGTDSVKSRLNYDELIDIGAKHIILNIYCLTEDRGNKDWWRYDITTGERV